MMALVALSCLYLHSKQLCEIVLWQLSYQHKIFKNLSKLVNFCAAILILKKICNIFSVLCFIISRKVKRQWKQKKICAVYGEGAITIKPVKSGSQSFMLEISHWTMLHSQVDQLKLIAIRSRH